MSDPRHDPLQVQVATQGVAHLDKGWAGARNHGASDIPKGAAQSRRAATAGAALSAWFAHERAALRACAETIEIETMERLRAQRLQEGAGRGARLGLRIRAPRRPGGRFSIEWFLVRRRGRTDYIARGDADAYPRAAFAGVLPWERQIALAAEQSLAEIRRRLRLMTEIEQRLARFQLLTARSMPLDAVGQGGVDDNRPPLP